MFVISDADLPAEPAHKLAAPFVDLRGAAAQPQSAPLVTLEPEELITNYELLTTNYLPPPYPDIFSTFNISGVAEFSRSLQGHPTASMSFYTAVSNEGSVRSLLTISREINLYGMTYVVASLSISRPAKRRTQQIIVTVQLQGKWQSLGSPSRNPLDLAVKLRSLTQKGTYTSVSRLCSANGVSYHGPGLRVAVPNNTSSSASTTPRQELESRAVVAGGFVYYSHPTAVEVRRWGQTPLHTLRDEEIINEEIEIDLGTEDEYRNTQLNLASEKIEEAAGNGVTTRYEYENALTGFEVRSPGKRRGFALYLDNNDLRDPQNCFDAGGPTKTERMIVEVNGTETMVEEQVYGWVFTSRDSYSVREVRDESGEFVKKPFFIGGGVYSHWTKVSRTVTIHRYDSDGYKTGSTRSGYRLARLRQEGTALEHINLEIEKRETDDADEKLALTRTMTIYEFNERLPIDQTTDYSLRSLREHYDDITKPDDDENWIEPRFCDHSVSSNNSLLIRENPETETKPTAPPVITVRKDFVEEQTTTVTSTKKPEKFTVTHLTTNTEGEGGKDSITVANKTDSIGRPSIHTRLNRPDSDNPDPLYQDNSDFDYYLNQTEGGLSEGSVSFPDVDDPQTGSAAARTQLSIANTKQVETVTLNILYQRSWGEGDRVSWDGTIWVILGIRHSQRIERGAVYTESFEVQLGKLIDTPVSLSRNEKEA